MTAPTLLLFSGLPGTGKSTLAGAVSSALRWPVLAIDDLVAGPPPGEAWDSIAFWDRAVAGLLAEVATRLGPGGSVIVDSVFMGTDRLHARSIAREAGARFRPVHAFVSDEEEWERRVRARRDGADRGEEVATWERVLIQRRAFLPWEPGTALLVDAVRPVAENLETVLRFVRDPDPGVAPLPELPFTPGRYHRRP